MEKLASTCLVIGRILLASLFVLGGVGKITDYDMFATMMETAGLPLVSVLLPITILLEVGGGLLIMFGRKFSVLAALVLAAFTIVVNVVFHDFWNVPEAMSQIQLSLFLKNISVAGGLLLFAGASLTIHKFKNDY